MLNILWSRIPLNNTQITSNDSYYLKISQVLDLDFYQTAATDHAVKSDPQCSFTFEELLRVQDTRAHECF